MGFIKNRLEGLREIRILKNYKEAYMLACHVIVSVYVMHNIVIDKVGQWTETDI